MVPCSSYSAYLLVDLVLKGISVTMKAIYITCHANPWVSVIKKIEREYAVLPVYWVGYADDDSNKIVPEQFPNTIYHPYFDAWKCIFPQSVVEKANTMSIDTDFLRKYASEELIAIKMMDRMDLDRRSFNFMERQRHFRNYVRHWMAAIELLKPDCVISPVMPHRVFDYTLYLLCQWHHIPYVFFDHTPLSNRFIAMDNVMNIGDLFQKEYQSFIKEEHPEAFVSQDIKDKITKLRGDYKSAEPEYMKKQAIANKRSSSYFGKFSRLASKVLKKGDYYLGKEGVFIVGLDNYYKREDRRIEDGKYPFVRFARKKLQAQKYMKRLRVYYESKTSDIPENEKFVIYFMHYQPEATTCPAANIYVDQQLCIDTLLRILPSDYKVYVKEHPSQFAARMEGNTSRMSMLYDDLAKNKRVRLVSLTKDSFSLIEKASAVATGTGTVGFEAMVRKKPVIIFGFSWYENYDKGVLRIMDSASASKINSFIENYSYDEHALMAYLAAVDKGTKKAYYYQAVGKDALQLSEDECVENIIDSLNSKFHFSD